MKSTDEICIICNLKCKTTKSLARHISVSHNITSYDYYINYMCNPVGKCSCGKPTTFINLVKGFKRFCSAKCSVNDPGVIEKKNHTCIERYGTVNASSSDKVKAKREVTTLQKYGCRHVLQNEGVRSKARNTILDKYGVDNVFKSEVIKHKIQDDCIKTHGVKYHTQRDDVIDKRKSTCIDRYGVSHHMKYKPFIDQRKQTCLDIYGKEFASQSNVVKSNIVKANNKSFGVDYYFYTEECKEQSKTKYIERVRDRFIPMLLKYSCDYISHEYGDDKITYKCNVCNNIMSESKLFIHRCRDERGITPCSYCVEKDIPSSIMERELGDLIASIIPDVDIMRNTFNVIAPYELDLYIKDYNIAIEFNGVYHHNELNKPSNYHAMKTNLCNKAGIQLLHIYEDDWLYKRDIVKSRLKSFFSQSNRIYARKCSIQSVTSTIANSFLDRNHIQGKCRSKFKYGLYYNDELVSLMTFGKSRFANEFELIRYCNKLNTTVVGGASRLFNHFIKLNQVDRIVSYADRSWSNGNMYDKIGFTYHSTTSPGYSYVNAGVRESRMKYQKHKLVKDGYDKNKTEHEIMLDRKIYRIYDSGNLKYIWTR